MSVTALEEAASGVADEVVAFARKLVQTASISGQEQEVATLAKSLGLAHRGDVIVACVVQEEPAAVSKIAG